MIFTADNRQRERRHDRNGQHGSNGIIDAHRKQDCKQKSQSKPYEIDQASYGEVHLISPICLALWRENKESTPFANPPINIVPTVMIMPML